jgi:hypothetical protein
MLFSYSTYPKVILALLGEQGKRESSPSYVGELGGGEGFFSSVVLVEGDLMRGLALEHGTPGAPVLYRPEEDQSLSALLAREHNLLLGGLLHEYTSSPLSGIAFVNLVSLRAARAPSSHTYGAPTRSTNLR